MDISDFILIASVLVALGIGVRSIRQTKELQERQLNEAEQARRTDRRHKALDETITWALDCAQSCYLPMDVTAAVTAEERSRQDTFLDATLTTFGLTLVSLMARADYIDLLAISHFSEGLQDAVKQLKRNLQAYEAFLPEASEAVLSKTILPIDTVEAVVNGLSEHPKRVHHSAVRVFKETVSIKAQDIPTS